MTLARPQFRSKFRPTLFLSKSVKVIALLFGANAVTHLAAQLLDNDPLSDITQVLLMPLLAAGVLAATRSPRSRLVKLLLLSLFFSWLGDALPRLMSGDAGFLTMVGFFLLAQFVFIAALWPYRKSSVLGSPVFLVPYVAFFVMLLAVCGPKAGGLLGPVIVYGLALMSMAILSTGLGTLAGFGGAIFFVSDALIAIRSFGDIRLPEHGFLIMSTYIAAQLLLAIAFVRQSHKEAA